MDNLITPILARADLDKGLRKTYLEMDFAAQDDSAHRVDVQLMRGNTPVDLSGATVTAYFIRYSDNATISLDGEASSGIVHVKLKKSCYNKPGAFALIIKATVDGVTNTVFYGEGSIFVSVTDTIVDEENVIPSLEDLLAQIATIEEATANASTAADRAGTAADRANAAAGDAEVAAAQIAGMTVSAQPSATAGAAISEVDGVKHITFSLPTGATPQITFQVETGAPGTDVQMTQSGTAENPVIHLTIPRGDTGAIDGLDYYEGTPEALGTASPGDANGVARGDHVHPMPTASDVGALAHDAQAADSAKLGGNPPEYYMADYGRCDVLWEGNWSGGTITVPNTNKYTAYKIDMASQGSSIFAFRHNTHIRGVGGFYYLSGSCATSYQFTATFSGDEWSFVACNSLVHNPNGNHGKLDDRTVSAIIGLF